tara:strand:- start:7486 stop:7698 length:213 start_codon:yes stop_codon:yes gene_type:complete
MTPDEAFEKIMKAADKYAALVQVTGQHITAGPFYFLTDEYKEVEAKAKNYRWELEQMVKAAIFALTKGGK